MSGLDAVAGPLALKLINKYGTPLTYTQISSTQSYNPATSQAGNTVASSISIFGLMEEYADSIRFLGDKLSVGTGIIDGDKKCTIAAQAITFTPQAGDKLSALNQSYTVTGVASQTSGSAIAYWVLHCRKA